MNRQPAVPNPLKTFVRPKGLAYSCPRDVGLTAAGKALVVIAALLCAGALGAGIVLERLHLRQADDRQLLADAGIDTNGVIVSLHNPSKSSESKRASVSYRFTADGREYRGQGQLSLTRVRGLGVGSPLPIRYAASDPHLTVPRGVTPTVLPAALPWLAAAGLISFACLISATFGRQHRLLAWGRAAPAVVTSFHKHRSSDGGTHQHITYEFTLLSGASQAGKAGAGRKGPAVGSVICVIYDPDRPGRNTPYPLALVRPR